MTNRTQHIDDHVAELLSGYLDGELTQQERQRVDVHCASCKECEISLVEIRALRESLGKARLSDIDQGQWREMMNDTTVKTASGIGWMLFWGGILAAIGFGLIAFITDSSIGLWEKLIVSAIYGGLLALFISVLRQRWIERKTDKYKDVEI
jgi:hypothetical protein